MYVYFMGDEDKKLMMKYFKSEDIDVSNFINILKVPTCILISSGLYILRLFLVKLICLVISVIGVIYLQNSGKMNIIVKKYYGQLN